MASPIGRFDGRAHAFVEDLESPELSEEDAHHLARVLRIRRDEWVTVSDGAGGWRACRLDGELVPEGPVERVAAPSPALTVAFAPVKGDRPEWVVQKLTELGIDRIVPVHADRSVVRWEGERAGKQMARLRRVAREAAMQSRSLWLPEVGGVEEVRGGLPTASELFDAGAAGADLGGVPPTGGDVVVVVGPEGGWSPEEQGRMSHSVSLSDRVLRAETAAVTLGALLSAIRGKIIT